MSITVEQLEAKVIESRDLALAGDIRGSQRVLNYLIIDKAATAPEINAVTARIDPDRVVFGRALALDDSGRNGLPLVEARFFLCSNIYGHSIDVDYEYEVDEEFIKACEIGYDNGQLHGLGNVVFDRSTKTYAFLVTELTGDRTVESADVAAVGEKRGVDAVLREFTHSPLIEGTSEGDIVMTAILRTVDELKLAQDIAGDFRELYDAAPSGPKL